LNKSHSETIKKLRVAIREEQNVSLSQKTQSIFAQADHQKGQDIDFSYENAFRLDAQIKELTREIEIAKQKIVEKEKLADSAQDQLE
jgi:hypothetical protein